jgi:hypothetical protein
MPTHTLTAKSASPPDSATVGTSGTSVERLGLDTAMARSLPDWICGSATGSVGKIIGTWLARTSVVAGASPRYGTWTRSMPAITLSNSTVRWLDVPLPADA